MSRYIDADATRDLLIMSISLTNGIDTAIKEAPSIDIVRCKECRWWIVAMDENNSDEDYLKCSMDKWPNADDFCSYGECKDKPQTKE